jgi:acyl CoA:acetate/3-ketoacid CoA transferase
MAKAAKLAIVEAENIVEIGEMNPNDIDLPGIFIDRIVPSTVGKIVEMKKTRPAEGQAQEVQKQGVKSAALARRNRIAKRASNELKDGMYVNLGVGMPTLAPSFLPQEAKVWIQSENGILGVVRFKSLARRFQYERCLQSFHRDLILSRKKLMPTSLTPARRPSPLFLAPHALIAPNLLE